MKVNQEENILKHILCTEIQTITQTETTNGIRENWNRIKSSKNCVNFCSFIRRHRKRSKP